MNLKRTFIPENLKITSWNDIEPFFNRLKNSEINSVTDLETWWLNRSELDAVLEEDLAWRYIKMNCNTTDEQLSQDFEFFIREIDPKINEESNNLDLKLLNNSYTTNLDNVKYFTALRTIKRKVEIFREKNIPLFAEMQTMEQEYGKISAEQTILYNEKELTMPQASNYLRDTDRTVRENIYRQMNERRIKDSDSLNDLFTRLIKIRQQIAENAGFTNYRDYKFSEMGRFDYSVNDCFDFHKAIETKVCKLVNDFNIQRKTKLGYDLLKPWDLEVDINLLPALKPFDSGSEMFGKVIECFTRIKSGYGDFLKVMKEKNYIDLDSRKGKAPGGFNYPLYESNIPFIYMNSSGNNQDVRTIVHECGHALHSFLSKDLPLVNFKNLPSEVAELASMSMELITMNHWDVFYPNNEDLKRAKYDQLVSVIKILPWIATVDKFQHWVYTHPHHSIEDRIENWIKTAKSFADNTVNWETCEWYFANAWQKQLHIFEVPFYYIEYAMAQLGAIAIWRNYTKNPELTLQQFENALALGYSKTIPEIYKTAGIKFDFSETYIGELIDFVQEQIAKI